MIVPKDLLHTPLRVLRRMDPEALVQLAHAVPVWTDAHAAHLDEVFAVRVIDALLLGNDAELDACDRLMGRAVRPSVRPVLDTLPTRWASRWLGYAQLLEVRRGQLANGCTRKVPRVLPDSP